MNNDFEGVWIPKEIILNNRLSFNEKFLLSIIKNLDNWKWCFASNTYFSEMMWIHVRNVQVELRKLKEKGLVKQLSFDWRIRKLRYDENVMADMTKSSPLPWWKRHIYNKAYNKEDNKTIYSSLVKEEAYILSKYFKCSTKKILSLFEYKKTIPRIVELIKEIESIISNHEVDDDFNISITNINRVDILIKEWLWDSFKKLQLYNSWESFWYVFGNRERVII